MIQYSLEYINSIVENNKYILESEIADIIDDYTKLVSSPNYNKSPHFLVKKSAILDANRSKIDIMKDSIKKILNKITEKNYDKLIIDLISIIKNIESEDKFMSEQKHIEKDTYLNETMEMIFNSFFIYNMNVDTNINICIKILEVFPLAQYHYNLFCNQINNLVNDIEICNSISFDEMERVNKKNNITKNKIRFYCRLVKKGKETLHDLYQHINYFQDLYCKSIIENVSKMHSDEIGELVLTFLNELDSLDSSIENENIIIKNIKYITSANMLDNKSLTNKMILKHKNVVSKLNL